MNKRPSRTALCNNSRQQQLAERKASHEQSCSSCDFTFTRLWWVYYVNRLLETCAYENTSDVRAQDGSAAITHANSTFLTVCQDEGAISQAWLKQAMAHKATLAQSVLKLTVIQVPCNTLHHCSPSHRGPWFLTKEPHILCLQNPTLTRTAWLPRGNICEYHSTENWLFSLPFYFPDNKLCDCLVRKWSFIPLLFTSVCLCPLHLPPTGL